MKILIINGCTQDFDQNFINAGCAPQNKVFYNIITEIIPQSTIDTFNSYGFNKYNLNEYDAFMWTGGGGNVYEENDHNKSQLDICNDIVSLNKPIWGSCWGMQVIVKSFGKKVIKSNNPEFGISKNIKIISSTLNDSIYKNKELIFDAPAHHYDVIVDIPDEFEIIAENNLSIQSIYSKSKNIFCTQYHPELSYDYMANLMLFWKKNYNNFFNPGEFNNLIDLLKFKDSTDCDKRSLELKNWLNLLI